jgi:hypothetical protein
VPAFSCASGDDRESDLDGVHLDVMGRCFWASVDEVERPVRQ